MSLTHALARSPAPRTDEYRLPCRKGQDPVDSLEDDELSMGSSMRGIVATTIVVLDLDLYQREWEAGKGTCGTGCMQDMRREYQ